LIERGFFSDDFVFIGASPLVDAEEWLKNPGDANSMGNILLVDEFATETRAVLLFEEIDEISLLTYRTAWFFLTKNGKITRLTEVRQSIHPNQSIGLHTTHPA